MTYKWASPHEWLDDWIKGEAGQQDWDNYKVFYTTMFDKLDADTIQDEFHDEMVRDGYFEPIILMARLLVEKHYPAAWVMRYPPLQVSEIVPVVVASNIPQDEPKAIRYWVNTEELRDDAYGIGLCDGEFELIEES